MLLFQPKNLVEVQKHVGNVLKREKAKRRKLKKLGIEYQFPGYTASLKEKGQLKKSKHTRFTNEEEKDNDTMTD